VATKVIEDPQRSDCDPAYCADLASQVAGEVSHLKAVVQTVLDILEGQSAAIDALGTRVDELSQRIEVVSTAQVGLADVAKEKGKQTQRWTEYDTILKTRFMSLAEDGSDWEEWALLYWFRWCRRQTSTKDPITSWADFKVRLRKVEALALELGSIRAAKDYLEYVAFRSDLSLNFHQAVSSGWVSKLSPMVQPWIEDRVAEAILAETPAGTEATGHPVVQKNLESWT